MDRIVVNCYTGEVNMIQLTQQEVDDVLARQPTKTQLKNQEIKERTDQYKKDIQDLQFSWLSASISDSVSEITKKQQIQSDLVELKSEYDADISNIKSRYVN